MSNSKGIVWLSSYPKSGNTWFRIVLSRLLMQSTNLSYINDIDKILGSPMVANRRWMDQTLGYDSASLADDELDKLRPMLYQKHAEKLKQVDYIKIHDAYTLLPDNTPIFPATGCLKAVYFIRNPLDVAISLAHHVNCPIDWSIYMMGNKDFSVPLKVSKDTQIRQKLLSWSHHVQSWVSNPSIRVLVLRYEDMFFNPLETFAKGMAFLNLDISEAALQHAIEDTSFDKLQHFEQQFGFKEALSPGRPFFRKGVVGDWKNTLNKTQIQRIIEDHAEVMRAYDYLDTHCG